MVKPRDSCQWGRDQGHYQPINHNPIHQPCRFMRVGPPVMTVATAFTNVAIDSHWSRDCYYDEQSLVLQLLSHLTLSLTLTTAHDLTPFNRETKANSSSKNSKLKSNTNLDSFQSFLHDQTLMKPNTCKVGPAKMNPNKTGAEPVKESEPLILFGQFRMLNKFIDICFLIASQSGITISL